MILVQNRQAPSSGSKQGAVLSLLNKGVKMESDWKKKLGEYREQINDIDKKLVDLLNDRAVVVMKVKKLKQKENLPLYDARREEDFEAMRASAEDALERIIGAGISSEALIGAIRRDPELRSYRFEDVMSMIDTLDSKDRVSGFLGNQSEF